jgi:hypothetical protein
LDISVSAVNHIAKRLGLAPRPVSHMPGAAHPGRYYGARPLRRVTLTCSGCGRQKEMLPSDASARLSDMCAPCAARHRKPRAA